MDLKTGYPYWLIKNGMPHTYPKLNKNIQTDVVIIGGGISGALNAYYLTQKGFRCVMLDKRTVGLGSTCASTSLVQYELDEPLFRLSKLITREKAETAYRLCVEAVNTLKHIARKIKFRQIESTPSLFCAAGKKDAALIREEFECRKKAGLRVKLLDRNAIKKNYGFSAPLAIESADGCSVDVYLLSHTLCRYALHKGLEIYDRTAVMRVEEKKSSLTVHTEEGFSVTCAHIVNCTGYEVRDFTAKKIVKLISTYAIASENFDTAKLWKNRAMIWNTADPYLYMRLTTDNRVIVGGRDEEFSDPLKRDKLIKRKSRLLERDFRKLFPDIPFRTEFRWAGTFGVTRDSLPYIGSMKNHPQIHYALGFGGNGITFSVIAAQMISDSISGKKNKHADLFGFERRLSKSRE